jgi:hypothetical protein
MLTATTLALPPRTNIPRPTKKNPKDTPDRAFNKLAWYHFYGTEGVLGVPGSRIHPGHPEFLLISLYTLNYRAIALSHARHLP